tara:strand:+ start:1180 stop:1374 length:195 start_codon:yes stop_codon:yes gene_type:complete
VSIYSQIPLKDLQRLRIVVKNNHMKHYPKEKVTDKEADRIIESITPQTRDKLIKLAVDYGITEL